MTGKDALLAEWDREMAGTRKLLALIPNEKHGWAPHAKSMTLAKLGQHLATMGMWASEACTNEVTDFATMPKIAPAQSTDELLALHDAWVAKGRAAIEATDDARMQQKWTLKNGEYVVLSTPRAGVLRGFVMNHMIHHRGQLTVYFRLLDIPIPGLYGPSADER